MSPRHDTRTYFSLVGEFSHGPLLWAALGFHQYWLLFRFFRDPCLCSLSFASRACPVKAIGLPFHLRDGDDGIRTHDPLLAGQVLSQLSYTPMLVTHRPLLFFSLQ